MDITDIDNSEFYKDLKSDLQKMLHHYKKEISIRNLKSIPIYFSLSSILNPTHRKKPEFLHIFYQSIIKEIQNSLNIDKDYFNLLIYILNFTFFNQKINIKIYINLQILESVNDYLVNDEIGFFIIKCFDALKVGNAFMVFYDKETECLNENELVLIENELCKYENILKKL